MEINKCKCGSEKEPRADSDDMIPSWIIYCQDCGQEQHGKDVWTYDAAVSKWNQQNPVKDEKKLTNSQRKALEILKDSLSGESLSARGFADKMWSDTETNMFSSSKNTGNGACRGKAAWLCAGSYMAKLHKLGWVAVRYNPTNYRITQKGIDVLKQNQADGKE